MVQAFRSISALIMREMATSYGKSSIGYLWAILEPVGGIFVLTVAFSLVMRSPALGESFPLFYATGMLPFSAYNAMQNKLSGAVMQNRPLLFYPRVTYMDAIISRLILTLVTQLMVFIVVFTGILAFENLNQHIDVVRILTAFLVTAFLGLGIGTLNSVLIYLFPSWQQVWSIVTRPLFLASCIFYLFDTLPEFAQDILWFNPLVHVIGLTREGFYATYRADYVVLAYPLAVGGFALFAGLVLLKRYALDMINE
ncbi:MAG: ABC transporter permease [Tropicimonas sp.]